MTFGRLGGGGNGMITGTPCDSLLSGLRTETITVLEAVAEPLPVVSLMTPGAMIPPPTKSEQHKMPGPCGWMCAIAPGMKLLPVMVNVICSLPKGTNLIWLLCCVKLTLVIDGGGGGGGGGGGVGVTAGADEAATDAPPPPHPLS